MIDKSLRKATAKRCGDVIAIHMVGGGDCLWLNMYLDEATGQMTCDSDIGSYAYHWGGLCVKDEPATDFWCRWLSCQEWLLRKCCGEQHAEMEFDCDATLENLRLLLMEGKEDDEDAQWYVEYTLEAAAGYDKRREFAAALNVAADIQRVDLPDEWWDCMVEHYTPWQKRFAEICREVIVPAIRAMVEKEDVENGQDRDV